MSEDKIEDTNPNLTRVRRETYGSGEALLVFWYDDEWICVRIVSSNTPKLWQATQGSGLSRLRGNALAKALIALAGMDLTEVQRFKGNNKHDGPEGESALQYFKDGTLAQEQHWQDGVKKSERTYAELERERRLANMSDAERTAFLRQEKLKTTVPAKPILRRDDKPKA